MLLKFIVATLVLAHSVSAATALTGNDLHDHCIESKKLSNEDLACTAYIRGMVDGIHQLRKASEYGRALCAPSGLTAGQARLIVEKYMRENPAKLHIDAGALSVEALLTAYQCAKPSGAGVPLPQSK